MSYRAEIFRDRFGVPHVMGDSTADGYFGLGVAAVEDRGGRLLLHQAFLKGELTAMIGERQLPDPSLSFLDALGRWDGVDLDGWRLKVQTTPEADAWSRRAQYWRVGEAGLGSLDGRSQALVTAYVAGVNWALRRAGETAQEYLAVTELAWWAWFEHVIALTLFHQSNAFAQHVPTAGSPVAVLASDPHYWLGEGHSEAQILCEADGFQLTGWWDGHVNLGFWGGTNGSVAMGITASGIEGAIIYRERLNDANDSYFDPRAQAFTKLGVADGGAAVGTATHHGPIIYLDEEHHRAFAVHSALTADIGVNLSQQLGIWLTATVEQYVATARQSKYLRGHRVIIDRLGHIGYVSNGPLECRDDTVDWSTIVDGSEPSGEPKASDQAPLEQWPIAIIDPKGGFVSSANDPPWVATWPDEIDGRFPPHIFGPGWNELGTRGAAQRHRLASSRVVDAATAARLAFDAYVPRAHLGVAALRRAVRRLGLCDGDDAAAELDALLDAWDGMASPSSVGMTVATLLHALLPDGLPPMQARLGSQPAVEYELEVSEPSNEAARAYWPTLKQVARRMRDHYGRLRQPWGHIHVFALNGGEIPAAGGTRDLESLFQSGPAWFPQQDCFDGDGKIRCKFGSRTVRVTEARNGRLTVRSVAISGQSPVGLGWAQAHDQEQARLYSNQKLKAVPCDKEAIIANSRPEDHRDCGHPWHETVGGATHAPTIHAASVVHRPAG
jgi:acyl-homoserine lactone acylase PvdQ